LRSHCSFKQNPRRLHPKVLKTTDVKSQTVRATPLSRLPNHSRKFENTFRVYLFVAGSFSLRSRLQLGNNAKYPQIAQDYEQMFRVLKALPCDIFLGAHGAYYDMEEKLARMKGAAKNPFIDPEGYKRYVADREQAFRDELHKQQRTSRK
jgi:hypothetical protein